MSGAFSVSLITRLSLPTIGAGVPAGTTTPVNSVATKPGTPASTMVGSSGASGLRVALVTPSARSLPSRMSGNSTTGLSNRKSICRPSRLVMDSAPPLCGTPRKSIFASDRNISPVRWVTLP